MSRIYRRVEITWDDSSIVFSSRENDPHAEYYLTDLKGWVGGVGVKGTNQARQGHGDFLTRKHRGPRAIVLEGTVVVRDEQILDDVARYVSGILWDGEAGTIKVTSNVQTLQAPVQLDGDISVIYNGPNSFRVQIPLRSPDSFLYSEPKTYQLHPAGFGQGLEYPLFSQGVVSYGNTDPASSVLLHNSGNAEAHPVFTLRGDFPSGVTINDGTGNVVEIPMAVYKESPVTVDMAEGTVTIAGQDFSHLLKRRDWFSIPPGGSMQPRIYANQQGSGWADIQLSDTYI